MVHQLDLARRRPRCGQPRLHRSGAVRGRLELKGKSGVALQLGANGELPSITFNSNPAKPKNRELLDPKVKEALEYATPRAQIAKIVFSGFATPYANLISSQSRGDGWVNPAVQPLPFDLAKANQMLDELGYTRNQDGYREVPATTGRYAQPAHEMSYGVIVPGSGTLDFNGDRQFQILAAALEAGRREAQRDPRRRRRPERRARDGGATTPSSILRRGTGSATSIPTSCSRS